MIPFRFFRFESEDRPRVSMSRTFRRVKTFATPKTPCLQGKLAKGCIQRESGPPIRFQPFPRACACLAGHADCSYKPLGATQLEGAVMKSKSFRLLPISLIFLL